ncbi:YaaA family protein [Arthrobacter sp. JSM 101049]|uniref:YaaA family protein n=1 Tax=Arthrobacter sp. JSM 101049 TaxID=929097 RepID=UPI00356B1C4F
MLILLPPSEGKQPATSGQMYDADALAFPELAPARAEVLAALAEVSASPQAHDVLGVGASLASEVTRNITLHHEPAAPAHSVYTGVLYEALGYPTLTPAQRRKADSAVVVISALWGAVGFGDRIPAYRLGMSVNLPGVGKLASWWKARLNPVLGERAAEGLVVDCRSSTYAAAFTPPPETTVAVSVFQLRGGQRKVVSHFAKHTRGELARHLLQRRTAPKTPAALLQAAREKWEAELIPATGRKAHQLNIILPEDHSFAATGN